MARDKIRIEVRRRWRPEVADAQRCSCCEEVVFLGVVRRLWLKIADHKSKTYLVLCRGCFDFAKKRNGIL